MSLTRATAETWLPSVEAGSVSLLIVDPPYWKVAEEKWDHRWPTPAAYLEWLASLADEWRRILAPNGSLYCFASPEMAARVEVMLAERFEILNSITWAKPEPVAALRYGPENFRTFVEMSERVLFAEHRGADSMALGESGYAAQCEELRGFVFEPLRAYLEGERKAAGVTRDEINEACGFAKGGMAGHYFSRSQWQLPKPEHYATMQRLFNRDGADKHLRREYEDLRREYEDLRREYEDLRRPFNVSADVPHTDVWTYPTVPPGSGRHSCEKPLAMLRDMIRASSREGDLVADCFVGSGSTWAAAIDTGRRFIGSEEDVSWVALAQDRAERHRAIVERRPVESKRPAGAITGPLFGDPA